MNDKILLYEELSLNAHPSLQTQHYDGWILRFANGYTNRANSVSPLYPSSFDLQEKIAECERRYFAQGLPMVFKLVERDMNIDKALEQKGYSKVSPTNVMDMDLSLGVVPDVPSGDCILTNYADDEWLNANFSFHHYSDSVRPTARQTVENVKNMMLCGRIVKNGVTVTCGQAVLERGYAVIQYIIVDEPQRGKGYGTEICESLLSAAKRLGARTAYLQVEQDNPKAANLYTKLGYKTVYSYWYRVKVREEK